MTFFLLRNLHVAQAVLVAGAMFSLTRWVLGSDGSRC